MNENNLTVGEWFDVIEIIKPTNKEWFKDLITGDEILITFNCKNIISLNDKCVSLYNYRNDSEIEISINTLNKLINSVEKIINIRPS